MTVITENKADVAISQEKKEIKIEPVKVEQQTKIEEKAPTPEPQEDPNFKAFREGRKKDRQEREAAEKRALEKEAEAQALKNAMEAILNKPQQQSQNQQYGQYQEEETEDQRIEKKVQAAITQREAQAEQQRIAREKEEYPHRLRQMYSDFQQTIAAENLEYLEYHYPEIATPLSRLPDGFDRWNDIYKAVKKFVPNSTTVRKEAAKADANQNKPRSMSNTGVTQPGEAIGSARLSEERKAANWERMERTRKGIS